MSHPHSPHLVLNKCRQFFRTGRTKPLEHRVQALKKLSGAIKSREQQIIDALAKDLGKPKFEAFLSEIGFVLDDIRRTLAALPAWMANENVSNPLLVFPAKSFVQHEPLGTCLIIAPWNYPFQLTLSPLVGAIAAGNCAVLKPSEIAPHTSQIIHEIISSIFAEDFVACLQGGKELSEALLKEKWDHIFFTGGTAVGKIVMKAAAEHLTPVTLELGGKSPCILDQGVPLERAINRITWGKFFNSGQTCVAPDYVLVQESDFERTVEQFKKTLTEFYGEFPLESRHLGRIVNQSHFLRLKKLMQDGEILVGGEIDQPSLKISPTLIKVDNVKCPLMEEEIFGPLLPIITYKTMDQALEFVNDRPKPLAFYIFTQRSEVEQMALERCSFGGGCINDTIMHLANHGLPFGGVGASGFGAYHGKYSFEAFSHKKSILRNTLNFELELRYPPYTEDRLKKVRFITRT
jgi:aldehyde dehydrogenase (NAD+)